MDGVKGVDWEDKDNNVIRIDSVNGRELRIQTAGSVEITERHLLDMITRLKRALDDERN